EAAGLTVPNGSRVPGPWRRQSSAKRAFAAAISLCNNASKLPAQAWITPLERSLATSAGVSSSGVRRKGHRPRDTLVSISAGGSVPAAVVGSAAATATKAVVARNSRLVGSHPLASPLLASALKPREAEPGRGLRSPCPLILSCLSPGG